MNSFNKLKETVASLEKDAQAFFEKGNKTAGTRLRKGMMDVRKLTAEVREAVTAEKNA